MKLPIFAYMEVFPNLFGPRHPYIVLKIFGGTPAGLIGLTNKELKLLAAPLALAHGTRFGITALRVIIFPETETSLRIKGCVCM